MNMNNEEIKVVAANICATVGLRCDYNIKTLATRKIDNAVIYGSHRNKVTAKSNKCIYSKPLDTHEDHTEFLKDVKELARKIKHFSQV